MKINTKFRLMIILNKIKEYQERVGVRNFGNGYRYFEHLINKRTLEDLNDIRNERLFLMSHGINVSNIPDVDFWEAAIAKLYEIRDKMVSNIFSISISILSFIISLVALIFSIYK